MNNSVPRKQNKTHSHRQHTELRIHYCTRHKDNVFSSHLHNTSVYAPCFDGYPFVVFKITNGNTHKSAQFTTDDQGVGRIIDLQDAEKDGTLSKHALNAHKIKEDNVMSRRDKINYYLDIAQSVATRSTCIRRKFGAIIVKNDEIISTGYVGAPRGRKNCCDLGFCLREKLNVPSGERYELCRSVHAEQNAIISADRQSMLGATMYLVGIENDGSFTRNATSCSLCKRMIINAGIKTVVVRDDKDNYRAIDVQSEWIDYDESLTDHHGY